MIKKEKEKHHSKSPNFYNDDVDRNIGNKTYVPTTWKVVFNLSEVDNSANYTLQLALASANDAELQVYIYMNSN